jgi:hypothetical protein
MVNLSIPAYLGSKFSILAIVAAIQAAILVGITAATGIKAHLASVILVLTLISLVGTGAGLCISAARRTTEQAIALLPIVLLPVILFGGGLRPLHESSEGVRAIARIIPTRWAFEANLLDEACRRLGPSFSAPGLEKPSACPVADIHFPDKPEAPRTAWRHAVGILSVDAGVLLVAAGLILLFRDNRDGWRR